MTGRSSEQDLLNAHSRTGDAVLAALGTDPLRGLSDVEAGTRLKRYGPNELTADEPVPETGLRIVKTPDRARRRAFGTFFDERMPSYWLVTHCLDRRGGAILPLFGSSSIPIGVIGGHKLVERRRTQTGSTKSSCARA